LLVFESFLDLIQRTILSDDKSRGQVTRSTCRCFAVSTCDYLDRT